MCIKIFERALKWMYASGEQRAEMHDGGPLIKTCAQHRIAYGFSYKTNKTGCNSSKHAATAFFIFLPAVDVCGATHQREINAV
jgi:hypothetical protein